MERAWLKNIRKEKNLTHQEVADQIKISRQYYGMIENGERVPSVYIAKKIGSLFDFDWTFFFETNSYKTLQKIKSA